MEVAWGKEPLKSGVVPQPIFKVSKTMVEVND